MENRVQRKDMITVAFGTRPEYIKLKKLIELLNQRPELKTKVMRVGQHDEKINTDFIYPVSVPVSDSTFPPDRLSAIISSVGKSCFLNDEKIVVVHGDTATSFAVALKAFNMGIKIAHIEAGMRTHASLPWPEEPYRKMISMMSTYHFCPSEDQVHNLKLEGIYKNIWNVGNTVIDNLVPYFNTPKTNLVICTIHRRESKKIHKEIIQAIDHCAMVNYRYEFLLITHPSVDRSCYQDLKRVSVIDPIPYSNMLDLIAKSRYIISDSGGISEEANYLDASTIILRTHTERPKSVCKLINPETSLNTLKHLDLTTVPKVTNPMAYGKGNSSELIADILTNIALGTRSS